MRRRFIIDSGGASLEVEEFPDRNYISIFVLSDGGVISQEVVLDRKGWDELMGLRWQIEWAPEPEPSDSVEEEE